MYTPRLALALALALAAGCGSSTAVAPAPDCPEPPAAVAKPAPPPPVAPPRVHWPALIAAKPAKAAPPELAEFGRLVGVWKCIGERRDKDGTWVKSAEPSTWTWFYSLGGRAVQDIFEPAVGGGAVGTNVRIYDPQARAWEIQWVTGALSYFERITARREGETMVLRGEVTRSAQVPPHARKITFFDIGPDAFEWKYEATRPKTDKGWQEFSRLHCKRTSTDPLAR
jgi:hypothetical protein